jgi:hypothetical protein
MKTPKSTSTRTIILTLALAGILAVPAVIIRAQSYGHEMEEQTLAKTSESKSERMEGSWVVTITAAVPPGVPQPPDFRAYASCVRGGVLIGSDARRAASKQHGTWTHLRGSDFAWTALEQLFDGNGAPGGTVTIRVRVKITGVDEFVGVSNAEERDAAGNLVSNRCGTVRGERITIEPLAPQCQNIAPPQG